MELGFGPLGDAPLSGDQSPPGVVSTVGSSATGLATCLAIGFSIWAAVASAAGIAAPVGVGAATTTSVAASAGTATCGGVGSAFGIGVGAAGGLSSCVGAGSAVGAGVGATGGTSITTGVASELAAADANASGSSSPSGVGAATAGAAANATGQSTAGAVSENSIGIGVAAGTSTASATGRATFAGMGSAAGSCQVDGISEFVPIPTVGNGIQAAYYVVAGLPPMGMETLTIGTLPVKGSVNQYVRLIDAGASKCRITATCAMMTVDTQSVRLRDDGIDPTDTTGHLLNTGDCIWLINQAEIANFSLVRALGVNATVTITYYGT